MHLLYIDESGSSEHTNFVLVLQRDFSLLRDFAFSPH